MDIKITTTSSEKFKKIEDELSKIEENFIKKFNSAEDLIFTSEIQLKSDCYFDERIDLPKGFIIEDIKFDDYKLYEENSENKIIENTKYEITINVIYENNKKLQLVFTNLYSPKKTIVCK